MVGREIKLPERGAAVPAKRVEQPFLKVRDLALQGPAGKPLPAGINFALARGEILGLAAVSGNGQSELVEVLVGPAKPTEGSISLGEIVFGFAEALAIRPQGRGIPSDLVLMVPYLATVISLWLATKRQNKRTGSAGR